MKAKELTAIVFSWILLLGIAILIFRFFPFLIRIWGWVLQFWLSIILVGGLIGLMGSAIYKLLIKRKSAKP